MQDVIHKHDNMKGGQPLCWRWSKGLIMGEEGEPVLVSANVDDLTCVNCLRMLAKDAGRYGNGPRPKR